MNTILLSALDVVLPFHNYLVTFEFERPGEEEFRSPRIDQEVVSARTPEQAMAAIRARRYCYPIKAKRA